MGNGGLYPGEVDEKREPKAVIRQISVLVYDGNRVDIERTDGMSATEASALLAMALAHITKIQFDALNVGNGTKIVKPILVVPGNGRPRR